MPNWKKVLVSGSNAHLNQVTASANIDVSGNIDVGGNLNVSQYIYHKDDANTYLNFTNDRLRFNIGGISYIDLNDAGSAPHDITFNDGSNNVDFIIKGDSNNPLFKTDASANRIGTHGKGTPAVAFHIGGSELRVDGNISGSSTGIGSFGSVFTATHITASGNLEIAGNIQTSGNISGSSATFNNAVSSSKVYAADGYYHSDDSDTFLKFPTGDKVQINAGDVNFIYAWQKDSDVNKLIFNEDNTDTDIVFRSANGSNNKLLYLDASADKIGIKTGVPTEALTVEGNISSSGALMGVTHVTASGNVEVTGNISGSITSTGSFGAGQFSGNVTPKTDNDMDLGSSAKRWANIYVGDMELSNEGSEGNEVDGTTGKWTIQEGENSLYLLNRKTNKKYKFKIEEVD